MFLSAGKDILLLEYLWYRQKKQEVLFHGQEQNPGSVACRLAAFSVITHTHCLLSIHSSQILSKSGLMRRKAPCHFLRRRTGSEEERLLLGKESSTQSHEKSKRDSEEHITCAEQRSENEATVPSRTPNINTVHFHHVSPLLYHRFFFAALLVDARVEGALLVVDLGTFLAVDFRGSEKQLLAVDTPLFLHARRRRRRRTGRGGRGGRGR